MESRSLLGLLPGDESLLQLIEGSNDLVIVLNHLAGEHDTEPAGLGGCELATSLDHPAAVLVELLPERVLGLPRALNEVASHVDPSHQGALRLEKWDVGGLESIFESVPGLGQSLAVLFNELGDEIIIFEDLLHEELSV